MEKKIKTVLKIGNSLGISLSELKKLGIKRGDRVTVYVEDGKISICDDYLEALKPIGLDVDLWDEFISLAIKSKRLKKFKKEDRIRVAMEEAIRKWIDDERHLYLKIKI